MKKRTACPGYTKAMSRAVHNAALLPIELRLAVHSAVGEALKKRQKEISKCA